jgi:hypothetical protein
MKRHYLKIPTTIAPWVPGGAKGDWQSEIYHDVSGGGRELVLEFLEANDKGPMTALHGDRFYVEIGRDRDRPDGVFAVKVQAATNPRRMPVRLKTALVLWPGGNPPALDSADSLFNLAPTEAEEDPSPVAVQPIETPSPLVLSLLAEIPENLRARLRPGVGPSEPEAPRDFLQLLRHLWARYRLDRYLDVSARHETLLRTSLPPKVCRGRSATSCWARSISAF